ncbi:I78 family peptidase inhibitor [Jannaschia marina]|uniref:I78 family peptidase inhibitor n=1 Tax=Jannaschia marina TaxID=2741674 RepID=UPI0015C70A65|nr:I78 family peptidase inhibitor [Jannaschia marina]
MTKYITILALLAALAACKADNDDPTETPAMPDPGEDTCDRAGYMSLIGQPIAAVTLPAELNHRVIRPRQPVTMDHVPERLNIELDDDGIITKLSCG